MTLSEIAEIATSSPGWVALILVVASGLIEVSPLKVNPWKAIGKYMGKAINGEVIKELESVKKSQAELKEKQEEIVERMDEQEKTADKREADGHRARILQYNLELIRNLKHTKEDFDDILKDIDDYEKYCKSHPDYPNNRAVHAVANIERVYDERVRKRDFTVAEEGEDA